MPRKFFFGKVTTPFFFPWHKNFFAVSKNFLLQEKINAARKKLLRQGQKLVTIPSKIFLASEIISE